MKSNPGRKLQAISLILTTLILAALMVACETPGPGPQPPDQGAYEVDPQFRDFYDKLGGMNTLGPAISALRLQGDTKSQFTVAALMVYDPHAPASRRFSLAPLGKDMGVSEPPIIPKADKADIPGERLIDGHILFPDFIPLYDRLGGGPIVGRPLTEVHYNPDHRRYEQYFENLGFYRLENEPAAKSRLLAYGVWRCDNDCRTSASIKDSGVVLQPQVNPPFSDAVASLGSDFTGFAITEAYQAADGKIEQIFENVVLFFDPDRPKQVELRPLQEKLGRQPDPLEQDKPVPGMFFYKVEDDKGYHVPVYFLDYITKHGSMKVSGVPVTALTAMKDGIQRQCFQNVCLDRSPAGYIRPAPLGYTYKSFFYQPGNQPAANPKSSREVTLQVWASFPMVAQDQEQEIGVSITENGGPLAGVEPFLTLTMPDGSERSLKMPLTSDEGQSRLRIPPIDAPNGTLVPYQVCIAGKGDEKYCFKDTYLIWNNP